MIIEHESHCPVPQASKRGERAVCQCRGPMHNAIRLEIFAYHVSCLCLEAQGTHFTLSPGGGIDILVTIDNEPGQVYFDSKYVGNREGAVKEFTRRVIESGAKITTDDPMRGTP